MICKCAGRIQKESRILDFAPNVLCLWTCQIRKVIGMRTEKLHVTCSMIVTFSETLYNILW